jgi:hypothetical protein
LKKRKEQGVQHINIVHAGNKESWNENTFTNNEKFSDSFVIDEYEDKEGEQDTQDGEIIKNNEKNAIHEGMILLDSQSTHSTFCSRGLLISVRDSNKALRMRTNGGVVVYTQIGELRNYGSVWYNANSIGIIISMSKAERKGHMVSCSQRCLHLTNPKTKKSTTFKMTPEGL